MAATGNRMIRSGVAVPWSVHYAALDQTLLIRCWLSSTTHGA